MKRIRNMSAGELAAYICNHLEKHGIPAVLTGGACVTIYSDSKYVSYDLDFIENVATKREHLSEVLSKIGFYEENRYFRNPETKFFIEFPSGPLSVGKQPVQDIQTIRFSTGTLKLLSPTECVKDRLAAYYHWIDLQSLEQALLVAEYQNIDLKEIEIWSIHEGKEDEFKKIKRRFINYINK